MKKTFKQNPNFHIHPYDIIKWMKTSPAEEEVSFKMVNGVERKYLKYSVVKEKMDHLCPDTWETRHFNHFFFYLPDKRVKVSGNIEVVVKYVYQLEDGSGYREVYRTLAGAATFFPDEKPHNQHWGATCKSLCIANAVQVLGEQFGWNLNPDEELVDEEEVYSGPFTEKQKAMVRKGVASTKIPPDKEVRLKYAKAVAANDTAKIQELETIYEFQIG